MKKPARIVEYKGCVYKVRGVVEIPDFSAMSTFAALLWINQNTYARGYSKPNSLAGMGGAISVNSQ